MQYKKFFIFIFCFSILYGGEYADSFLRTGVSARAIAMGNSIGALDRTETAFLKNPAGLAYQQNLRVGMMYTSQFGLADQNYLGLALPLWDNPRTSLTFSWVRFQVDDIIYRPDIVGEISDQNARRDSVINFSNSPFKTFQDREEAIYISLARMMKPRISLSWKFADIQLRIPFGVNFKILRKQLYQNKGDGIGMDFGTGLYVNGESLTGIYDFGDIYFGFSWRDFFGTTIYWNTKKQDNISPSTVFSVSFEQPLKFYNSKINICWEYDSKYNALRYGAEYDLFRRLAFRAGLENSKPSLGLGLKFNFLNKFTHIDYSFRNHDLGAIHRIGGGFVW